MSTLPPQGLSKKWRLSQNLKSLGWELKNLWRLFEIFGQSQNSLKYRVIREQRNVTTENRKNSKGAHLCPSGHVLRLSEKICSCFSTSLHYEWLCADDSFQDIHKRLRSKDFNANTAWNGHRWGCHRSENNKLLWKMHITYNITLCMKRDILNFLHKTTESQLNISVGYCSVRTEQKQALVSSAAEWTKI